MASTIYRRQSMAQLYEKLRAQDDDDGMAWLAQYSPDGKFDEPYVPATAPRPPSLSTISFASPVSSSSLPSSMSDSGFYSESSEDHFDFDSNSDVDPEPPSLDLPCTPLESSQSSPLLFQPHDVTVTIEPLDLPYIPSAQEVPTCHSRSSPPSAESHASPVPVLPPPSIALRRVIRPARKSSKRYRSPIVFLDFTEEMYSEGDAGGSEDEYVPSPTLGSRKRNRSARSNPSTAVSSSQRRSAQSVPHKRPRHSPLPRNAQTTLGIISTSPVAKNNPWACPYCKWVQRNHRTPDLKRHIRTHTRLQRPAQWVCCGVPLEDAKNYDVPADAEPYMWGGEEMIGGCCKEFSRRDALKRHLDNDHINCVGNFAAFAGICEDEV